MRIVPLFLAATLLAGCGLAPALAARRPAAPRAAALPGAPADLLSAFDRSGTPLGWPDVISRAARAEVAYLGELHDDPATHRLELATLQALSRGGQRWALSLEMFETDVQEVLDSYLAGTIQESEFLARSRPWSNYAADYRPMVEFCRENGIRVVAANVPRRLASLVAKGGLQALAGLPDSERRWAHIPASCPADAYWEEFRKVSSHPGLPPEDVWKWYEAQCLKDETMARSISLALAGGVRAIHVNGAFHSDKSLGVPPRVARFRPGVASIVMTARPTDAPGAALPPDLAGVADVALLVKHEGTARVDRKPAPDPRL